jgi:hypothetical protein
VTGLDWQDPDPTAYDPDNPLALLEKAVAAGEDEQTWSPYGPSSRWSPAGRTRA